MDNFGRRTMNLDVMVVGKKTIQELLDIRTQLVRFLNMDTAGMEPQVDSYPLGDGRGGVGTTLYQPFVEPKQFCQPLTTSFVVFDSWPEHFTITLKSCVCFDVAAVVGFIAKLGRIMDMHSWTLGSITR